MTALVINPVFLGYLTVIGFFLTAVGFIVAIWQIRKVKASADAAAAATEKVIREITLRDQLIALSEAIGGIELLRTHAHMKNDIAAMQTMNQLRENLARISNVDWGSGQGKEEAQKGFTYLANIQQELTRRNMGNATTISLNLNLLSNMLHDQKSRLRLTFGG